MKFVARHINKITLLFGIFLIGRAGWGLFHAQALQAVFDLVIGFYLVQDYSISNLKRTVDMLIMREIERTEQEMGIPKREIVEEDHV